MKTAHLWDKWSSGTCVGLSTWVTRESYRLVTQYSVTICLQPALHCTHIYFQSKIWPEACWTPEPKLSGPSWAFGDIPIWGHIGPECGPGTFWGARNLKTQSKWQAQVLTCSQGQRKVAGDSGQPTPRRVFTKWRSPCKIRTLGAE